MNGFEILRKYYPESSALRQLLLTHSCQVAKKALRIAWKHPELNLNTDFLLEAAMVHDIGIYLTDASGIYCTGSYPYLLHGYLGAKLMRMEGREDLARVCERHTGTGLYDEDIRRQQLPLPPGIYHPVTLEEQVVCYADKFFSKSHPERERTIEQTARSLEKWGEECVIRFNQWAAKFE